MKQIQLKVGYGQVWTTKTCLPSIKRSCFFRGGNVNLWEKLQGVKPWELWSVESIGFQKICVRNLSSKTQTHPDRQLRSLFPALVVVALSLLRVSPRSFQWHAHHSPRQGHRRDPHRHSHAWPLHSSLEWLFWKAGKKNSNYLPWNEHSPWR